MIEEHVDAIGRWVFEIDHPCGHRETHRIRVQEPDGSLGAPPEAERQRIRRELRRHPCNACVTGHPRGRALVIVGRVPDDEVR